MKRRDLIQAVARQCKYLLVFALVSTMFVPVNAQDDAGYRIKAVFLYNFTQFVQWPVDAFNGPHDPLVIGILGDDPFGRDLDQAVSGEKGNEHFIIIRRYSDVSEIRRCHILFINNNDTIDMDLVKAMLPTYVLLVSDGEEEFLDEGGMIRFVTRRNKIQLQINLSAIKAANLEVRSKMLRLAERVDDDP